MGVGDFIHSRETGQHVAANDSFRSRQLLAGQAKVGVPATKLMAPLQPRANGMNYQEKNELEGLQGNAMQGDMFDTDVEDIDESTIADMSVADADELPNVNATQYQHNGTADQTEQRPSFSIQPRRRQQYRRWYENLGDENLGDQAIRNAGFGSDDTGADVSHLASEDGHDVGEENDAETVDDWYPNEGALNKQYQDFWTSSSKRKYPPEQADPAAMSTSLTANTANPRKPLSEGKISLPRNIASTPRSRFHRPKPSLLDTYRVPAPGRQPSNRFESNGNNDAGNDHLENTSPISAVDLDQDGPRQPENGDDDDELGRHSPASAILDPLPISPHPGKRHIEPDYPPHILYQKSFSDLQEEPFDYTPPPITMEEPPPQTNNNVPISSSFGLSADEQKDKIGFANGLTEEQRRSYFSELPMDEWEECGDQLIDHFATMLTKMKELRHARRKTAALFEAEIKRRHDKVEAEDAELSRKLEGMREGGAGVLRGVDPCAGGQTKATSTTSTDHK